jgi:hypothetical protein
MTVSRVLIATITATPIIRAVIRNTKIPPPRIPCEMVAIQTDEQISNIIIVFLQNPNISILVYRYHHSSNSLPRVGDVPLLSCVLVAVVPLRVAYAFLGTSRLRNWRLAVA